MTNKAAPLILICSLTLLLLPYSALSVEVPNKRSNDNEDTIINLSNYAYPNPNDPNIYHIVLFGTNDIHGNIFPKQHFNPITKDFYKQGGAEYIANYISILRKEWGTERLLWLDAGDQFEGGKEGELSNGDIMNAFYNTKKLNAIGIGNHDISNGYDTLLDKAKASTFDYLVNNLYDNNAKSAEFIPNQKRSKIYTVGRVKIGVIGVTTSDIKKFDPNFPSHISVEDSMKNIQEDAKALRAKGVNAVILLAHLGAGCDHEETDEVLLELKLRTKDTVQSQCNDNEEFYHLMGKLGIGLIDAVVAGHRHGMNHHWIQGIPTIQSIGFEYSNVMYLPFDINTLKLISDKISIEGPLPSCDRIFSNTKRCEYVPKDKLPQAGLLSQFTFHGSLMQKDPELNEPLSKWRVAIDALQNTFITTTAIEMKVDNFEETPLMNLFNDVAMKVTEADLSFFNVGGFRSKWHPGPLNEIAMFEMSPFSTFVTFEMTGIEVMRMLKIIQGESKALYPTGGLKMLFNRDSNEKFTLIDAVLFNGVKDTRIEPKKTYKVCTSNYLANGGSAMGKVLKWYKMRGRFDYPETIRDDVTKYLKNSPEITEDMFYDANNPRIRIVKGGLGGEEY